MVPRAKEPIDLVLLKGKSHRTKEEIEERRSAEIKARQDDIRPPDYLTPSNKKTFNQYAEQLIEIGIMSNLDCEALARYINSESEYRKVLKRLRTMKVHEDPGEYKTMLIIQEKLFNMCRSAASDLGLTITSRCKLVVPKAPEKEPENKFSRFIEGNRGTG